MRRSRLSTLMILIVIAALGVTLVVQQRRAARREAELRARMAEKDSLMQELKERLERLADWVRQQPK